jgi:hypothetical protein
MPTKPCRAVGLAPTIPARRGQSRNTLLQLPLSVPMHWLDIGSNAASS